MEASNTVGSTVSIKRPVSKKDATTAISNVFNTAELLSIIVEQLPHHDLLKNARLTCKGFDAVIKSSPVISKRTSFAINARESDPAAKVNVGIKELHISPWNTMRFGFKDRSDVGATSFDNQFAHNIHKLSASNGFRNLRVCDEAVYKVEVNVAFKESREWYNRSSHPSGRPSLKHKFELQSAPDNKLTFGAILDQVDSCRWRCSGGPIYRLEMAVFLEEEYAV